MTKIALCLLSILIISISTVKLGFSNNLTGTPDTILPLSERAYYESIFSEEDKKELELASSLATKGQENFDKYLVIRKKYDEYVNYAKKSKDVAKKKKALKNSEKYEKKALKKGHKAMNYFTEANKITYDLYDKKFVDYKKLKIFKKDTTTLKMFDTLNKVYSRYYDSAQIVKNQAEKEDNINNFDKLIDADNLELKAINLQEFTFGIFNKDTLIIDSVKKHYFPPKVIVTEPVFDPNIYVSKKEQIIPLLSLTTTETSKYKLVETNNLKADGFIKKYEENAKKVIETNDAIEKETVVSKKRQLQTQSNTYTKNSNTNLVSAAKSYYDSNLKLYNVYAAKISDVRLEDSVKSAKGMEYEELADLYYIESEIALDKTISMAAGSEKFREIMYANEYLLIAIQHIENAMCLYLSIETTDVIDNTSFTVILPDTTTLITETTDSKSENKDSKKDTDINKGTDTKTNKKENKTVTTKDTTSTYTYESSWFYNSENANLQKLSTKKGTYFKVQAGYLKSLPSIKDYKNYEPISVDKFKNKDEFRVLFGEYQTTEAAELALEKIKKIYPEAYIVGFVDGTRVTYAKAKESMTKASNYDDMALKEKAKIETSIAATTTTTETSKIDAEVETSAFVTGKDVTTLKAMVYLIQLGTYALPQTREDLKNLKNIYSITENGLTRYMLGVYYNSTDAKVKLNEVKNLGFADAYITAFNNGMEIGLTDALIIENAVDEANKIVYKVQVAAFVTKLSDNEFYIKYPVLKGKYSLSNYSTTDNLIAYAVGNCETYSEAKAILDELGNLGITDKYIVAFKGTEKISVTEARKITDK